MLSSTAKPRLLFAVLWPPQYLYVTYLLDSACSLELLRSCWACLSHSHFPLCPTSCRIDGFIPRDCGTFISDEELRATEEHFRANKVSANPERDSADDVAINVYFHVISQDGTPPKAEIFR
jgi:hypothetical protein